MTGAGPAAAAIADAISSLADRPFAFYGHSMGTLLSFEVTRELRRRNQRGPIQLFVAARQAPQLPDPHPPIYNLPDKKFLEQIKHLYAPPDMPWHLTELIDLMLPTLRADLTIWDTYAYTDEPRLDVPIAAFGGEKDRSTAPTAIEAWREQTDSTFEMHLLPGGHFFQGGAKRQLLAIINRNLQRLIDRMGLDG